MSPEPASSPVRPGADALYRDWAAHRVVCPHTPLSPASVAKYRTIWDRWVHHLTGQQRDWHTATAQDVDRFLSDLRRRRNAGEAASPVSRRRYWRVLMQIYAYAVQHGWTSANPALDAGEVPRSERMASVVLSLAHLAHARDLVDQVASGAQWQAIRDRAVLAVLLDQGLTAAEIAGLRADQVLPWGRTAAAVLRLDGRRVAQQRDLRLSSWARLRLQQWLDVRASLMPETPACFVSRKHPGTLQPWSVFHLASQLAAALERDLGLQLGHRGPGLFRTAVIAGWLQEGRSPLDVVHAAGLASLEALNRLMHGLWTSPGETRPMQRPPARSTAKARKPRPPRTAS